MPSTSERHGRPCGRFVLALLGALVASTCGRFPASDARPASRRSPELRVMTFNLRYGTAPDGENAWPNRKALVMETVRRFEPGILGVQEALRFQLDEIHDAVPGLAEVGVGRDDGEEGGEYAAILYDPGRFGLLDHGTFWLSDTPAVPGSMSWGNRYPRVVTWARLRDHATGAAFVVLNTHWDHESQYARERSAADVMDWIVTNAAERPVILMGDFNAGEANGAFQSLLDSADGRVRLLDTFRTLHPDASPVGTFHGFSGDPSGEKIDAILASPSWRVVEAGILRAHSGDRFPSDHFPVTAVLEWPDGG